MTLKVIAAASDVGGERLIADPHGPADVGVVHQYVRTLVVLELDS